MLTLFLCSENIEPAGFRVRIRGHYPFGLVLYIYHSIFYWPSTDEEQLPGERCPAVQGDYLCAEAGRCVPGFVHNSIFKENPFVLVLYSSTWSCGYHDACGDGSLSEHENFNPKRSGFNGHYKTPLYCPDGAGIETFESTSKYVLSQASIRAFTNQPSQMATMRRMIILDLHSPSVASWRSSLACCSLDSSLWGLV